MPYMIVNRGGRHYVHKRGADGQPEGRALGTHDDHEQAQRQLAALESSYRDEQKQHSKYAGLDMRPPENVADVARRALEQAEGVSVRTALRELAQRIASRSVLSYRDVAAIARANDDDDDIRAALRGGTAGRTWARNIQSQMALIDGNPAPDVAVKTVGTGADGAQAQDVNVKALVTSDAGSVGFGVAADDAGVRERDATGKFHIGDEVLVVATNQPGTISAAQPLKSGEILYTVQGDDGFALATASDIKRTKARAVKTPDSVALALRYVKRAAVTLRENDAESVARFAWYAQYTLIQVAYRLPMSARKWVAKAHHELNAIVTDERPAIISLAQRKKWWAALNAAHRYLARAEISLGTRSISMNAAEKRIVKAALRRGVKRHVKFMEQAILGKLYLAEGIRGRVARAGRNFVLTIPVGNVDPALLQERKVQYARAIARVHPEFRQVSARVQGGNITFVLAPR